MEVNKNNMSRLMIAALGLGIASAALAQGMPGQQGQQNQQQAGQPTQPAPKAPAANQQGVKRDLSKALKQEQKARADMKKAHKAGIMHPIKDIRYREKADRHADKARKDLKKASRLGSPAKKPSATGAP